MMDYFFYEQLTLEDAMTARDLAIARSQSNAAPGWKAAAAEAVRWCAQHMATFTTDDVLLRLADQQVTPTHNLSALGPVMLSAARAGVITKTGQLRPTRLAQRHRDLTVWASAPWARTGAR
jgi:hypothetical protein